MSHRLKLMGQRNYANGFELTLHEHALDIPFRWKKAERIFVNSMSDLYHKDVPEDFILRVFDVMTRAHWHTFKILTKRADRLEQLSPRLPWPANVWQGVSVENADYTFRIDHLRRTGAKVKFLSVEPLLGPIPDLDLTGIDWVIVGGESGPGCRPMEPEWVHQIRDACRRQGVALFVKQTGEKLARRLKLKSKKGGDTAEWPDELRVREFPSLPVIGTSPAR
jgi:protein gp37